MIQKKRDKYYIDKSKLHGDLEEYIKFKSWCVANDRPIPTIPYSIITQIMTIVDQMATRHNFNGYSFKDEMLDKGYEVALKSIPNYDYTNEKKNPFGYFSMGIYWAFIGIIKKENKEHSMRWEYLRDSILMSTDYESVANELTMEIIDERVK